MKALNLLSARVIRSGLLLVCFATISLSLLSYDTGPGAGYCNAPGDNDCTSCHSGSSLSTSAGVAWNTISLVPASGSLSSISHGVTYSMNLTFADTTSVKYGFQVCVLPSGASSTTASIGSFTATNSGVQIVTSSNRSFIEHTYSGTAATSHTHTWNFSWTAPTTYSGGAVFYVIINSTDNDNSSSGDLVYAKTFSATVLPVKFLSFDVSEKNDQVLLNWSTASEINSSNFVVEKSNDASNWFEIGTVKASGNSSSVQQYHFVDDKKLNAFYRLKQVDLDGKFDYSQIVHANKNSLNNSINIYPLPANNTIHISSDNIKNNSNKSVKIFDMKGNLVSEKSFENNEPLNIDVSSISKGLYILQLTNGIDIEMKKVVIE